MGQFDEFVTANLAEGGDKKGQAEALARAIPARRNGGDKSDEQKVREHLVQAREAAIEAGGEPKSVETLAHYRWTALWVSESHAVNRVTFRWLPGVSFTAHAEARARMSYEEFTALPSHKARDIRTLHGKASKDGPPESVTKSWTRAQKAEAAKELLADEQVASEVYADRTSRRKAQAAVERARQADPQEQEMAERVDRAKQRDEESRRKAHTFRFIQVDAELGKAKKTLQGVLETVHGVDFSDEESDLLAGEVASVRHVVQLVELAIAGSTEVDWDKEFADIAGDLG